MFVTRCSKDESKVKLNCTLKQPSLHKHGWISLVPSEFESRTKFWQLTLVPKWSPVFCYEKTHQEAVTPCIVLRGLMVILRWNDQFNLKVSRCKTAICVIWCAIEMLKAVHNIAANGYVWFRYAIDEKIICQKLVSVNWDKSIGPPAVNHMSMMTWAMWM